MVTTMLKLLVILFIIKLYTQNNVFKHIIKQLSMNEEVIIMKQDKGRGVIIMNSSKYLEKCLSVL